jgi:hypothetical protein
LAAIGFDVHNFATIANFGKGHGQAIATSTACAANAVGIVFGFHGQAKIEHMGNGGHVNTASRNIGGHQNLNLAIAQCHQSAIAQTLTQSTVQCNGIKAILL